jgi:tRNA G18 (ribose-2'-O)-methylase SpoU
MPLRRSKRQSRNQALLRYEKHRRKNLLAEPGIHDIAIVLDHLKASFNVAKIFRSAEAFGIHEIHLIDIGPFDPAPAKGAFKSVPARWFDDFSQSHADLVGRGYSLFVLEADGGTPLTEAALPEKSAFIFGHEEMGTSFDPKEYTDIQRLSIPQYGRIESLNVSVAASILMYEYIRQHGGPAPEGNTRSPTRSAASKARRKRG